MQVSQMLGNSPHSSNSYLTFSSVDISLNEISQLQGAFPTKLQTEERATEERIVCPQRKSKRRRESSESNTNISPRRKVHFLSWEVVSRQSLLFVCRPIRGKSRRVTKCSKQICTQDSCTEPLSFNFFRNLETHASVYN